jgi:hypothetical protein
MFRKRVGWIKYCSQTTLRPCGRSGIERVFGNDQYIANWSSSKRRSQASSTRAKHHNIGISRP